MAESYGYTPKQISKMTMYQIRSLCCDLKNLPGKHLVNEDEMPAIRLRQDRDRRLATRGLTTWD